MTAPAPGSSVAGLWDELTATMAALVTLVEGDPRVDSDELRAEGLRYLTRLVAGAVPLSMEATDPAYPRLLHMLTPTLQYGLPSPDCCYLWASVHGDHEYRIHGNRGSAAILDVEVRAGHPADLAEWSLHTVWSDLGSDPDSELDLVLSRVEGPGNRISIPEGRGTVLIRQYCSDWDTEQPSHLHIERLGMTYPPPPLGWDQVTDRIGLFQAFLANLPQAFGRSVEGHYAADPTTLRFDPISFGWSDLSYGKGHFRCDPAEAVLLELEPPDAPYWSIQLGNHFWESLDWDLRQTSINHQQAVRDLDGKFRAVISHTDPGIPNWLDTAGHRTGLIAARYYRAGNFSAPTLRTVPLDQVRAALPSSTPVITPGERRNSLERRARSVRRRNCD